MDISEETTSLQAEEPIKINSGGYPWDFFSPSISTFYCDQYSCSICYLVLRDPFKCKNNHLYCKSCIYNWIVSANLCSLTCPVCRDTGPFEVDSKIKSELDNHNVCCSHDRCCWIGKLSDFYNHIHGKETIQDVVPDLLKTVNQERLKKSREDGFVSDDRIVSMMSVIYADIEHRRRLIENIRTDRNESSLQQLGDIQHFYDRLLSLRQNIDSFFGQTDSFPLWTQINHMSSRNVENSISSISSGHSDTDISEEIQNPDILINLNRERDPHFISTSPVLSLSSEFDFSDDNSNFPNEELQEFDELPEEIHFQDPIPSDYDITVLPPDEETNEEVPSTVQTNLPSISVNSERPDANAEDQRFSVATNPSPNLRQAGETLRSQTGSLTTQVSPRATSNAASRLRYDYLSRRFNFRPSRRNSGLRRKLR